MKAMLGSKPLARSLIRQQTFAQNFQGHLALQSLVAGQVNHTHAALTKLADNVEVEPSARKGDRHRAEMLGPRAWVSQPHIGAPLATSLALVFTFEGC